MSTVRLRTQAGPVEMPAVTTVAYAAKRVAEALGWDPHQSWLLAHRGQLLDPDALVADLDGEMVLLIGRR